MKIKIWNQVNYKEYPMPSKAESYLDAFWGIYDTAKQKPGDTKWLNVYYVQGYDRIKIISLDKSPRDDSTIIINGVDTNEDHCVIVVRVEAMSIVMKFEDKEESKHYESVGKKIGF